MQWDGDMRKESWGGLKHGGSKGAVGEGGTGLPISDVYFLFFVTSSQMILSTSETTNSLAGVCLHSLSSQAVVDGGEHSDPMVPSPICGILCQLRGNSEEHFATFSPPILSESHSYTQQRLFCSTDTGPSM